MVLAVVTVEEKKVEKVYESLDFQKVTNNVTTNLRAKVKAQVKKNAQPRK